MRTERVIAYIDGFNLYHGLCDAQLESSRWLDLHGVKTLTCSRCSFVHSTSVEKKTDVNIAVRLLEDTYDGRLDVALVISADSDLAPPIEAVRRRFASKTLLVAAPPARWSSELKRVAHAMVKISSGAIRQNRLPDPVITPDGRQLRAPAGWLPSP